ncbi:hypothetical protein [Portibacter marinus]|uniref:hypothetical protein n=1 Tax=Portibacter marinus TaxID=2898660 RepID=UPI001F3E2A0C|nr:hypothetical protein [Portibacter marinus]
MDKFNKDKEQEMKTWFESGEFNQLFIEKEPSDQMDMKFYDLLEKHRKPVKETRTWLWFLRIALPIAGIVLAFVLGLQFSAEDAETPNEDFAVELLTTDKAGEKINLVSNTKIKSETDQKVIDALLYSLSNDESANVRLACIQTLYDYAYLPRVRTGLIQAVSQQQSPVVLANLAEAINASGKKLSKEEFMNMIDKDLPPPIKSSIDASLIKI